MAVSTEKPVPATAPITALVHDIGKLLISRFVDAGPRSLRQIAAQKAIPAVEAERQMFGFSHTEIGGAIARKWNFPAEVIHAIERHHEVPATDPDPLLDAVQLANLVTKTLGVGLGAEGFVFPTDPETLVRMGIDFTVYCRICARTASKLEELQTAFCV
jgi:putative nucleotidyltransferase with HDIG domain